MDSATTSNTGFTISACEIKSQIGKAVAANGL